MKLNSIFILLFLLTFRAQTVRGDSINCEDFFKPMPTLTVEVPSTRLEAQNTHRNPVERARLKARTQKILKDWLVTPFLKWVSGYNYLIKKAEEAAHVHPGETQYFFGDFLGKMDISYRVARPGQSSLPTSGPLVLVSNHPFGLVESLALVDHIIKQRDDLKIIVNELLLEVVPEELHKHFITVSISATASKEEKKRANMRAISEARSHVKGGGSLLVFPYGKASLRTNNSVDNYAIDGFWKIGLLLMMGKTDAQIVNFFSAGENSETFYKFGDFKGGLGRKLLFLREIIWQRGQTLQFVQGQNRSNSDLRDFFRLDERPHPTDSSQGSTKGDNQVAFMAFLKLLTYNLARFNPAQESDFQTPEIESYFSSRRLNQGVVVFKNELEQLRVADFNNFRSEEEIRDFFGEDIYYLYDEYRKIWALKNAE